METSATIKIEVGNIAFFIYKHYEGQPISSSEGARIFKRQTIIVNGYGNKFQFLYAH